jgi:hypothetical protein
MCWLFAAGLFLAVDLDVWHESIALVGAGLATVLANVQIVFVAFLGWAFHRERPTPRAIVMIAVMLVGVALTSGLARGDAYGTNPVAGAAFGVAAGACYSGFLLLFRASNRSLAPTAGPLLDATLGMLAGGLASIPFDPKFASSRPGRHAVADSAGSGLAGHRLAVDRQGAAAPPGRGNFRPSTGPAGLCDCVGNCLLRGAPIAAAVGGLGHRAGRCPGPVDDARCRSRAGPAGLRTYVTDHQ